MLKEAIMNIDSIDFAELYRQQIKASGRKPTSANSWDLRAEQIAKNHTESDDPYLTSFLSMMDLSEAKTILDVGCGPGTIGLALADKMEHVYALDYSIGMINIAKQRVKHAGFTNVTLIQRSWQDNWDDIPQCDIVIASRSTLVDDLYKALVKLNEKARLRVYTTHTVDPYFTDPALLALIGNPPEALPNYIYAINILYQMGINPCLSYITSRSCQAKLDSYKSFVRRVAGTIENLSAQELSKLHDYYQRKENQPMRMKIPKHHWALVSWQK